MDNSDRYGSFVDIKKPPDLYEHRLELLNSTDGHQPLTLEVPNLTGDHHRDQSSTELSARCDHFLPWLLSVLLDVGLLLLELILGVWLAISFMNQGRTTECRSILILLALPSVINVFVWIRINEDKDRFRPIDNISMIVLVLLGFPSPVLLFITALYLSAFQMNKKADSFRCAATILRLFQAIICSCPLLLINCVTLIDSFTEYESDIRNLNDTHVDAAIGSDVYKPPHFFNVLSIQQHLTEVNIHGIAFAVSLLNVIRAASCYNERQSSMVIFSLVCIPFLSFTVLSRVLCLSLLIAFLPTRWTCFLFVILICINLVTYHVATLTTKGRTWNDGPARGGFLHAQSFVSYLCKSVGSVFVPIAYSNDPLLHYSGRVKGCVYLVANYISHALVIGVALAYTILYWVPNEVRGVVLPQPNIRVQVPDNQLIVAISGLELMINIPAADVDLSAMPPVALNIGTSKIDRILAVVVPILAVLFVLPFMTIRAVLMGFDCFVVRRSDVPVLSTMSVKRKTFGVECRTFVALLCGLFGVVFVTIQLAVVVVFVKLHF